MAEQLSAKDRVKKEMLDLDEKIFKLENFLGKVQSNNAPNHEKLLNSLSGEQKKLLKKQLKVMKTYSHILSKRLRIWTDE